MTVREIYRFHNGMTRREGHLCWDTQYLFSEIIEGMKRCFQAGYVPESMGIDTWAVDFVLLDGKRQRLGPAVGYRDQRTNGMTAHVYKKISEEALYERTGIQKQVFNTIYQLTALKRQQPGLLESAETLLMIPDYFHFLLTGKMGTEYTNGTTTQLMKRTYRRMGHRTDKTAGISDEKYFRIFTDRGQCWGRFLSISGAKSDLTAKSCCRRPMIRPALSPRCF